MFCAASIHKLEDKPALRVPGTAFGPPEEPAMHDMPTATPLFQTLADALPQRDRGSVSAHALARALDVMDYGVLLVHDDSQVVHMNQVARQELDDHHPLQIMGGILRVRRPQDVAPLHAAIACACGKGLQRMLSLGDAPDQTTLSIIPIAHLNGPGRTGAVLVFAKRQHCTDLTAEAFARHHQLTQAELRVLKQLCLGRRPADIAKAQGVALCTVRTQIGSLREKTRAPSIGDLVSQVGRLPPMPQRASQ